jgi:hypothetical protein
MKLRRWIGLGLLIAISVIGELMVPHDPKHTEHWWSVLPAFYAIYGFVGCVLIIVFSKILGKLFLQQKEDYYNDR